MKQKKWFDRKFNQNLYPELVPNVMERLSSTPARLEERIGMINSEFYTIKMADNWAIQENVGIYLT